MKVEMSWNGEDLDISLSKEEAFLVAGFLEFFCRNKIDNVTPEEYSVAQKLYSEINTYVDEEVVDMEYVKRLVKGE